MKESAQVAKVFIREVGDVEFRTNVNALKKANHLEVLMPIIKSLNLANARVLDAGCGTGVISDVLWERRRTMIGVDISREQIKVGKKLFNKILFILGDVHHLPFRDDSFDAIIFHSVLTYVRADRVLVEARRVGKNKSFLILCEFNPLNPFVKRNMGWGSRRLILAEAYHSMLYEKEIYILKSQFVDFTPTSWKIKQSSLFSFLCRSFSLVEKVANKLPLLNRYAGFIFIIAQLHGKNRTFECSSEDTRSAQREVTV